MTISLTLGNTRLPLRHGLARDAEAPGQLLLREARALSAIEYLFGELHASIPPVSCAPSIASPGPRSKQPGAGNAATGGCIPARSFTNARGMVK